MAQAKSQGQAQVIGELIEGINACSTVTDLFKLGSSDAFRAAAHSLPADELQRLRSTYREHHKSLDGRVKLESFDGRTIDIIDIDYGHSDRFQDNAAGGEFVALKFRPVGETAVYRALSSSARILRFANSFATPPTEAAPCRVLIKLEPVADPERAAKGQRQWRVKRLALPQEVNSEGAPF